MTNAESDALNESERRLYSRPVLVSDDPASRTRSTIEIPDEWTHPDVIEFGLTDGTRLRLDVRCRHATLPPDWTADTEALRELVMAAEAVLAEDQTRYVRLPDAVVADLRAAIAAARKELES